METYELVWDGVKKHFIKLIQEPKIWSSSTLYTDQMKEMRKDWFREWFIGRSMNPDSILDFHKHGEQNRAKLYH